MPHGFLHIEIPCASLGKAKRFYNDIFGWKMDYVKEEDYVLFDTGAGINGAFYHSPEHAGHQGVVVYIQVQDIEATLNLINKHGGKTVVPKTPDKQAGHFALFNDPDGNVLGIWQQN